MLKNKLQTPQKKNAAQGSTNYIALGTKSGGVSLYSFSKGEVSCSTMVIICIINRNLIRSSLLPDRAQSEGWWPPRQRNSHLPWQKQCIVYMWWGLSNRCMEFGNMFTNCHMGNWQWKTIEHNLFIRIESSIGSRPTTISLVNRWSRIRKNFHWPLNKCANPKIYCNQIERIHFISFKNGSCIDPVAYKADKKSPKFIFVFDGRYCVQCVVSYWRWR